MSLSTQSYKGTRDIYPEDMRFRNYIFATWRRVCESFGYEEYDAPLIEPLELYAAKTGEEIVNEQTYTFVDRGERKVAIRPEMTPSLARMVAAKRQELPMPARLYSISNFMRYERPQRGREREFWQLNVDLFGVSSVAADIEIITISDKVLREFGAKPDMYTILVNDRRLTDYIMREYLGLDEIQTVAMIKLFDRRSKISIEDFDEQAKEILGDPITTPSGDGEGRSSVNELDKVKELLEIKDISKLPEGIRSDAPVGELEKLISTLRGQGISNIRYDATLMRVFDYYTGIVFEVFDNNPENNRAMFGGGRYDGLVGLFGVEDLPVVGVAPGETTMIEFLRAWSLMPELKPATDVFLIPVGDVDVSVVAGELRAGGVNVAVDLSGRKIDKSIKSAVKMGAPYVMFVGDDEIKTSKFKLKNLATESEETLSLSEIILKIK
jgi:histidyl-tRNA synthetase